MITGSHPNIRADAALTRYPTLSKLRSKFLGRGRNFFSALFPMKKRGVNVLHTDVNGKRIEQEIFNDIPMRGDYILKPIFSCLRDGKHKLFSLREFGASASRKTQSFLTELVMETERDTRSLKHPRSLDPTPLASLLNYVANYLAYLILSEWKDWKPKTCKISAVYSDSKIFELSRSGFSGQFGDKYFQPFLFSELGQLSSLDKKGLEYKLHFELQFEVATKPSLEELNKKHVGLLWKKATSSKMTRIVSAELCDLFYKLEPAKWQSRHERHANSFPRHQAGSGTGCAEGSTEFCADCSANGGIECVCGLGAALCECL